jgi:hypothetical protein
MIYMLSSERLLVCERYCNLFFMVYYEQIKEIIKGV